MKKWLIALVAVLGLASQVLAADGLGFYTSNKLWLFNGAGISYQTGILRLNVGASLLYVLPLGLQGGLYAVLPLGQGSSSVLPYVGAGIEGDLWLVGDRAGLLLFPHALAGLELPLGPSLEIRLGYIPSLGQTASGAFAFGFAVRNPF